VLQSSKLILFASFAAFFPPLVWSQSAVPDANGNLVFKANARTVVVDVVVTDRKGKPVERLPKEDFLVMEDAHPQQVTSFEEHSGVQPVQANLPDLPPNVFTNIPRIKPTDAVTVLLLDGLNTELQNQSFVRAQMLKHIQGLCWGQYRSQRPAHPLIGRLQYCGARPGPGWLAPEQALEATLIVYDQNGKALNWLVREVNLEMDAARYEHARENGVNFRLEIDAPWSGVFLRGGVYDLSSNLAGTLEIPLNRVTPTQTASAGSK